MRYEHMISLGHFCSVSMELEKIGLRNASYPFDWLITSLTGILELMENNFDGFLDESLLAQSIEYPWFYKNLRYNIWFYHDFDQYRPLSDQIAHVTEKYSKRIARFFSI